MAETFVFYSKEKKNTSSLEQTKYFFLFAKLSGLENLCCSKIDLIFWNKRENSSWIGAHQSNLNFKYCQFRLRIANNSYLSGIVSTWLCPKLGWSVLQIIHFTSISPDSKPPLLYRFPEQTLQPGPSVSLKCIAKGNPPPRISWSLDGFPLPQNERYRKYINQKICW